MKSKPNVNVICPFDCRVNFRRQKSINRLKNIVVQDFKNIYPQDKDFVFIFQIKPAFYFSKEQELLL